MYSEDCQVTEQSQTELKSLQMLKVIWGSSLKENKSVLNNKIENQQSNVSTTQPKNIQLSYMEAYIYLMVNFLLWLFYFYYPEDNEK